VCEEGVVEGVVLWDGHVIGECSTPDCLAFVT
jgi:hypothetical protein